MNTRDIVGSMFVLVLLYLLLNNGKQTTSVISGLASGTSQLVKTLQGRG